jgi:hypothetical protein
VTIAFDSFSSTVLDALIQSPLDARAHGGSFFIPAWQTSVLIAATPTTPNYYPYGIDSGVTAAVDSTDGGTRDKKKCIIIPEGGPIAVPANGGRWVTFGLRAFRPYLLIADSTPPFYSLEYTLEVAIITASFDITAVTWNTSLTLSSWYTISASKSIMTTIAHYPAYQNVTGWEDPYFTFYQDTFAIHGLIFAISGAAHSSLSKSSFVCRASINTYVASNLSIFPSCFFSCYEGF